MRLDFPAATLDRLGLVLGLAGTLLLLWYPLPLTKHELLGPDVLALESLEADPKAEDVDRWREFGPYCEARDIQPFVSQNAKRKVNVATQAAINSDARMASSGLKLLVAGFAFQAL